MNIDELYDIGINKNNIQLNEPMKNHTSFKIGGTADVFIKVKTIDELKKILDFANKSNEKVIIIGNGSNVLVKDNGIRGLVLKIDIKKFKIERKSNSEDVYITLGSGEKLGEVAGYLLKEKITGFEEISGIPGTIGGAIRMNAGAHGVEMKDLIVSSKYMDMFGNIHTILNDGHKFEYRNSIFSKKDFIILETCLKLKKGNLLEIKNKMQEYLNYRKEKQPIEFPSAGSTFKRGKDFVTAQLIDECGLKGFRIGDAQISTKHAGFVVNIGNATAKDVIQVIEYVQKQISNKFGKIVETEVEIIGE